MSRETKQQGQSLIETIMALFVLTTGLTSGLALAIFTFGTSSEITNQITATGLAREGIEVIRSKRDSNWLSGTLADCSSNPLMGPNQKCYTTWLNGIGGTTGAGTAYRAIFNPTALVSKWTIFPGAGSGYRLYRQADDSFSHTITSSPTQFFRKIVIVNQNTPDPIAETQILVRSVVWWEGKRCPSNVTDYNPPAQDTPCKIVSEEYLTNWRNY